MSIWYTTLKPTVSGWIRFADFGALSSSQFGFLDTFTTLGCNRWKIYTINCIVETQTKAWGVSYFYFQFQGGKYETPINATRVMFNGDAGNFGEITYTFFFLMMLALAINYFGLFYTFPYFVRPQTLVIKVLFIISINNI